MIIPKHKALFVHVPKTAGQAVENYFLTSMGRTRKSDNSDLLMGLNPDLSHPKRLDHLSAKEYTSLGYFSEEDFKTYFKFAFVRNPWARLVSLYRFRGFSSVTSFPNFVNYYLPEYMEKEHWFFRSQAEFICDENDQFLCDFVGRLEDLDIDFNKVLSALKLPATNLDRANVSAEKWLSRKTLRLYKKYPSLLLRPLGAGQKPNYRDYYNPKTMALVHRMYERDINLLKYQF
ncbi:sulfotransferase family 2 domain-containing protein [Gilvibacter sp.]|uniref:sulfotransferase family 2 domain-containing protein n=1 Tax=Gilvibacter sp. TaxID=2729997 RepID=UPI0025C5D6CA|nr:sulfotransferase family 2 domain-containing protein [Gilvibacter sp.]NQX76878.1 sulfotransferase family 2 domain-containing protein [Gilvibacter sp.]